jgi:predicted metal-dependent phosphoesterase TrpH
MYKIDLHTHSVASPDGGISADQYRAALSSGLVDYVAITDHNRIDFALRLHQEIGSQIIVGEEIMSSGGEIIGLFLTKPVVSGLTPQETMRQIKAQGGLVYIPHPFETVRKGLPSAVLEELYDHIDMVEVCNGRAFLQNRSQQAVVWSRLNNILPIASSDAHGLRGLGKTFTSIDHLPTRENILEQMVNGKLLTERPNLRALLYPRYHRIHKKVRRYA